MSCSKMVLGASLILVAVVAFAEEPAAPQPTAEHQALESWTGSWSGEGELKPGPFGAGGPVSWTEECSWFEGGGFHVVCRSQGTGPMGPMKGLGIIGYNPGKMVYTHYGVDSTGWSGFSEGTRNGDTWTFHSEEMMDGATYRSRFIMTMTSAETMTFSWAISEDGSEWTVLMDGISTKKN